VALGEGGTDFRSLFRMMQEKGYTGLLTLQAARGEDGKERETVKHYKEFIQRHVETV
jgi:sugar phosphate isomerase/epimerase